MILVNLYLAFDISQQKLLLIIILFKLAIIDLISISHSYYSALYRPVGSDLIYGGLDPSLCAVLCQLASIYFESSNVLENNNIS